VAKRKKPSAVLFPPLELECGCNAWSNELSGCCCRRDDVRNSGDAVELRAAMHGKYQHNRLARLSINTPLCQLFIISINYSIVAALHIVDDIA